MSYSTALFILAANVVAVAASYVVTISAYALWRDAITIDRGRALAVIVVGVVVVLMSYGIALRLGGQ